MPVPQNLYLILIVLVLYPLVAVTADQGVCYYVHLQNTSYTTYETKLRTSIVSYTCGIMKNSICYQKISEYYIDSVTRYLQTYSIKSQICDPARQHRKDKAQAFTRKRSSDTGYSTLGNNFYVAGMRNANTSSTDDDDDDKFAAIVFTNSDENIKFYTRRFTDGGIQRLSYTSGSVLSYRVNVNDTGAPYTVNDGSYKYRHRGIRIFTMAPSVLSVLVMNFASIPSSLGSYLALPSCDYNLAQYQYYAVSTSSPSSNYQSEMLLVGNADDTSITVTPSVDVIMPRDAQDPNSPLVTIASGTTHTVLLHTFHTLLVETTDSDSDLTGTKVISDKPLTVISGHECGSVPGNLPYCDHISVQIPPTVTWGRRFLLAPFGNRTAGQYYKMIAGRRNVTVKQTCASNRYVLEKAGDSVTFFTLSTTYCYVESNKPLLLTQLAPGGAIDGTGDPTIAIVPPLEQYNTEVVFEVQDIYGDLIPVSYINIITVTMPEVILMDNTGLTVMWNPIRDIDGSIVGYATQVANVSTGTHILSTPDDVKMSVMVYGFSPSNINIGYSYTAGMKLEPLVEMTCDPPCISGQCIATDICQCNEGIIGEQCNEFEDVGRESRDVDTTGIIAGVVIGLGMPLLIALILSVLIVMFFVHAYKSVKKPTTKNGPTQERSIPGIHNKLSSSMSITIESCDIHVHVPILDESSSFLHVCPDCPPNSRCNTVLSTCLIPSIQLKLKEKVGEGEFGVVYHGIYIPDVHKMPQNVAVKTLKGTFNIDDVHSILEESYKMKSFNHPNVLTLIGVCTELGPAPYIVMPFMSGGSLLAYLKKERHALVIPTSCTYDDDEHQTVLKQLLSLCLQVAQGMEYLSSKRYVHRDLAARNCMIDDNNIIKVADFGLTEKIYVANYFRQDNSTSSVKLPMKWLAIESIHDGIFSEKTDVWSYGVLMWEIFSGGKKPYPGLSPRDVTTYLDNGERLEIPKNMACSNEIYTMMINCWDSNPKTRPTFSQLVKNINGILEPLAGYLYTRGSKMI